MVFYEGALISWRNFARDSTSASLSDAYLHEALHLIFWQSAQAFKVSTLAFQVLLDVFPFQSGLRTLGGALVDVCDILRRAHLAPPLL